MQVIIQDVQTKNLTITKALNYERQQKLFYLQKKIYQASQECNSLLVHGLQKLLLSLSSIQELSLDINKSYNTISVIKQDKLIALNRLNLNNINETLLTWCLEAEWKPKIKTCYRLRYKQKHIIKWSVNYQINPSLLQNIDKQYLLSKMQSIQWIRQKLDNHFDKQYLLQERIQIPCKYKNTVNFKLTDLLYLILTLGTDWNYYQQKLHHSNDKQTTYNYLLYEIYLFNITDYRDILNKVMIQKFLYNISITTFCLLEVCCHLKNKFQKTIQSIKYFQASQCVKELMLSVKHLLYSKNHLGHYRIKFYTSTKGRVNQICRILNLWMLHYSLLREYILDKDLKQYLFRMLYVWARKSKSQINYNMIKNINSSLNLNKQYG